MSNFLRWATLIVSMCGCARFGQSADASPGAFADIIAVKGDPLHYIKVLENVQFVMKDGQVFRSK